MARLAPASTVGRFRVSALIGASDLAETYEVQDAGGRPAVLKLFAVDLSRAPNAWAAFEQESRSFASAATAAAAAVHEFGIEPATQLPFMIREKLPEASLYDEVQRSGPLAAPRVSAILHALAPMLDAAHARGLVHRALKPQNLFVSSSGIGESVAVRIADSSTYKLRTAQLGAPAWGGTPGWIAADAADPNAASSPRMDVYALGLTCFFVLTGRPLFRALGAQPLDTDALWREMTQPAPAASMRARELGGSLGSALDLWFAQAVAAHQRSRFASIADMAAQFATRIGGLAAAGSRAPSGGGGGKRGATQLGLGPSPNLGGTLVLDPKEAARSGAGKAVGAPPAPQPPQPDARGFGGTLIMDQSALKPPTAPPVAVPPAGPAGTVATLKQFAAPPPPAPPDFQQDDIMRPAPAVSEAQGPVALASGQPLAFMHELPRPAAAPPPPDTAQYAPASLAEPPPGVPTKRNMLLPLLIFGGIGLIALLLLVAWALFRRDDDSSAPAASASAPPTQAPVTAAAPPAEPPVPPPVPSPPEPATPPATDALVTFRCEPGCDRIVCDGKTLELERDAARLPPGKHVCRLEKSGFITHTDTFEVRAGEPLTREALLKSERPPSTAPASKPAAGNNATPAPAKKKQPCGTFINPCK